MHTQPPSLNHSSLQVKVSHKVNNLGVTKSNKCIQHKGCTLYIMSKVTDKVKVAVEQWDRQTDGWTKKQYNSVDVTQGMKNKTKCYPHCYVLIFFSLLPSHFIYKVFIFMIFVSVYSNLETLQTKRH